MVLVSTSIVGFKKTRQMSVFVCGFFVLIGSVAAETLYQADYQYDTRGFVTNLVEQVGGEVRTRQLEYDRKGQLIREETGVFEVQYEYDHVGNRIRQTQDGAEQIYSYNARNELLQQQAADTTRYLYYDLNGSLTNKVQGANITGYDWDSRGRLVRVHTNGTEAFQADYAGDLKRLRKAEGGDAIVYRHDGPTTIQEITPSGALKELIRSDRGTVSVGGILYAGDEEGTNTFTYNGVGSTVLVSENDGAAQNIQYDAFGNVLAADEAARQNRLANSREFDASTGLYFHGARYYDATIGRYISLDPARDGINPYVYARNAPLSYTDPTGLFVPLLAGIAIGLGFGAVSAFWEPYSYSSAKSTAPTVMTASTTAPARSFRETDPGRQLSYELGLMFHYSFVDAVPVGDLPQVARAGAQVAQVLAKGASGVKQAVKGASRSASDLLPPSPMTQQYRADFRAKYGVDELGYGPQTHVRPIDALKDEGPMEDFVTEAYFQYMKTKNKDYTDIAEYLDDAFQNGYIPADEFHVVVDESTGAFKAIAIHDTLAYRGLEGGRVVNERKFPDRRSLNVNYLLGVGGGGGYEVMSYLATKTLISGQDNMMLSSLPRAESFYLQFNRSGVTDGYLFWSREDITDWGLLKPPK